MSERECDRLYWRIKERQNKMKIDKSRQQEREIVKKMTRQELEGLHADYLMMVSAEEAEKKNSEMNITRPC